MRIRRPIIIISAILALGAAAAAVSASEISAAAQHTPSAHVQPVPASNPGVMYQQ
jgi:hypothetical protein